MLWSGQGGLTPPLLAVSLTVKYPLFFLTTSLINMKNVKLIFENLQIMIIQEIGSEQKNVFLVLTLLLLLWFQHAGSASRNVCKNSLYIFQYILKVFVHSVTNSPLILYHLFFHCCTASDTYKQLIRVKYICNNKFFILLRR